MFQSIQALTLILMMLSYRIVEWNKIALHYIVVAKHGENHHPPVK
jgi:hypothetical protein